MDVKERAMYYLRKLKDNPLYSIISRADSSLIDGQPNWDEVGLPDWVKDEQRVDGLDENKDGHAWYR